MLTVLSVFLVFIFIFIIFIQRNKENIQINVSCLALDHFIEVFNFHSNEIEWMHLKRCIVRIYWLARTYVLHCVIWLYFIEFLVDFESFYPCSMDRKCCINFLLLKIFNFQFRIPTLFRFP